MIYYIALGISIDNRNIIVFHLHSIGYIEQFYKHFSDSFYIVSYRSPIHNINSCFRQREKKYNLHVITHAIGYDLIKLLLFGWKEVQQKYKLSLFSLKLEELHKNPRETMQKVANFMDIKFEDSLLQSTMNGVSYQGCDGDLKSISGFNLKAVMSDDYKKRFSALDKFVLENLCSYHKEYVEYKTPFRIFCFLLYLLPIKYEWLVIKGIILFPKLGGRSRWDRLSYFIKGYIKRVYDGLKYTYAVLTYLK